MDSLVITFTFNTDQKQSPPNQQAVAEIIKQAGKILAELHYPQPEKVEITGKWSG